ncbi:MAG: hypothetical protein M1127_02960 [Patescibacteria group bacterium]|nr:hypothetical protein [Patescibacteria group bacterium]
MPFKGAEKLNAGEKKEYHRGKTFEDALSEMLNVLETKQPEIINPTWVEHNAPGACYHVLRKGKNSGLDNKRCWQILVDSLPDQWKSKWRHQERMNFDFNGAVKRLAVLLNEHRPRTFNGRWIGNHDKALYGYFMRHCRTKDKKDINWDNIINSLPAKWKDKWRVRLRDETREKMSEIKKKYRFESAIERLIGILEESQPTVVNSGFIMKKDPSLYSFFVRFIRDKNGGVDWDRIIVNIPEKFRARFEKPKTFNREKKTVQEPEMFWLKVVYAVLLHSGKPSLDKKVLVKRLPFILNKNAIPNLIRASFRLLNRAFEAENENECVFPKEVWELCRALKQKWPGKSLPAIVNSIPNNDIGRDFLEYGEKEKT